jgi:hypothetical protein
VVGGGGLPANVLAPQQHLERAEASVGKEGGGERDALESTRRTLHEQAQADAVLPHEQTQTDAGHTRMQRAGKRRMSP